ncbi:MAG: glycoside hydrolase family 2 TIM barrel-domain containing protein [Mediterraneibacter gnavus]
MSLEDHQRDMEIIKELGATTLRLAHYQHAQEFYDLCDENGLVVWAEIPYITMHMSSARANTLSQMEEALIVQDFQSSKHLLLGLSNGNCEACKCSRMRIAGKSQTVKRSLSSAGRYPSYDYGKCIYAGNRQSDLGNSGY